MNDFEDEIIDLEEEIPDKEVVVKKIEKEIELPPIFNQPRNNTQSRNNRVQITNNSQKNNQQNYNSLPNKRNIFKNNVNDDLTSRKLQSLENKNRSFPLNNINRTSNLENQQEQSNNVQQNSKITNTISKKIASNKKVKTTTELMALVSKSKTLKIKIIAIVVVVCAFLLLLIAILASQSETETLGENTHSFIAGEMNEDELIKQLIYYDYCNDKESCKEKGVYTFFTKLKELYDEYSKACGDTVEINKPCGITLNTALIIETINYYHVSENSFFNYDEGDSSSIEQEEGFSFFNFFSELFQKHEKQKEIEKMEEDVENLALAQAEYVEETCKKNGSNVTLKYYQVSFNKYISYLKYGNTSSHPNYNDEPFEKDNEDEACEYAKNDYISVTNYENNQESSEPLDANKKGVEIATYALGFVGRPYKYGGTNLETGVDCSGFTMKVMEHFGITIPRTSGEQLYAGPNVGTNIDNALPGDIIVYKGHVAIYLGNNSIVHASNSKPYPKGGIKISNNAEYKKILGIIRVWK